MSALTVDSQPVLGHASCDKQTYWLATYNTADVNTQGDAYVAAVGAPAKLAVVTAFVNAAYSSGGSAPTQGLPYLASQITAWAATCASAPTPLTLTCYEGGWGKSQLF